VSEADPAVELGVAGQALLDAGHADEDHAHGVPVVVVPDLLAGVWLPAAALAALGVVLFARTGDGCRRPLGRGPDLAPALQDR